MNDVKKALNDNRLIEIFGAGTACVVSPVNRIKYKNVDINLPNETVKKLSPRLYKKMTEIYYGEIEHDWMFPIDDV